MIYRDVAAGPAPGARARVRLRGRRGRAAMQPIDADQVYRRFRALGQRHAPETAVPSSAPVVEAG